MSSPALNTAKWIKTHPAMMIDAQRQEAILHKPLPYQSIRTQARKNWQINTDRIWIWLRKNHLYRFQKLKNILMSPTIFCLGTVSLTFPPKSQFYNFNKMKYSVFQEKKTDFDLQWISKWKNHENVWESNSSFDNVYQPNQSMYPKFRWSCWARLRWALLF